MKRLRAFWATTFLGCLSLFFLCGDGQAEMRHQTAIVPSSKVATPGTLFSYMLSLNQGSLVGNVDLYTAFATNDGTWSFLLPVTITNLPVPYKNDFAVSDEKCLPLPNIRLPSSLPEGNYTFGGLLVSTGSDPFDSDTWVSNLALSTVYFSRLSPAQQVLIDERGYPEQFVKTFLEEDEHLRVDETWVYVQQGKVDSFINGSLVQEVTVDTSGVSPVNPSLHPDDYHFDTTVEEVRSRLGEPLQTQDVAPADVTFFQVFEADTYYYYPDIIFGFHDNRLVSAIASK